MEFCREFAIHDARDGYSAKRFVAVKRESDDDNTADIMGMIVEELGANGELSKDDFEELLEDLAAPLVKWRSLKVPKYKDAEAYNVIYEIVLQCYEHKAYHTAQRMAALLYAVTVSQTERSKPIPKKRSINTMTTSLRSTFPTLKSRKMSARRPRKRRLRLTESTPTAI